MHVGLCTRICMNACMYVGMTADNKESYRPLSGIYEPITNWMINLCRIKGKVKAAPVLRNHGKMWRGMEIQLLAILTSTLDGGEWTASRFGHVNPLQTYWMLYGPQNRSGRGGKNNSSCTYNSVKKLIHSIKWGFRSCKVKLTYSYCTVSTCGYKLHSDDRDNL
jgi:hypothetical protein